MNKNAINSAHEPTEAEIAHTAYLLWLESGRAANRDLDNWLAAKELLRHRRGPAADHRHRVIKPIPPPIPATEPETPAAATSGSAKRAKPEAPILAL